MPSKSFVCVLVVLGLLSGTAQAQTPDDALAQACPGIARWQAAEQQTHADQTDAAMAARDAHRHLSAPEARRQLLQRLRADQDARDAAIAASKLPAGHDTARKSAFQRVTQVDGDNLAWLEARVATSGFPTVLEVGEQGMAAAFLLVQHADRDPAFQSRVLSMLAARGPDMGIRKSEFAMLTDRVLHAQGKPQRYGTQFMPDPAHPGQLKMDPVEDPAGLDRRRAAMELPPIDDYRCVLRAMYGTSASKAPASAHG